MHLVAAAMGWRWVVGDLHPRWLEQLGQGLVEILPLAGPIVVAGPQYLQELAPPSRLLGEPSPFLLLLVDAEELPAEQRSAAVDYLPGGKRGLDGHLVAAAGAPVRVAELSESPRGDDRLVTPQSALCIGRNSMGPSDPALGRQYRHFRFVSAHSPLQRVSAISGPRSWAMAAPHCE